MKSSPQGCGGGGWAPGPHRRGLAPTSFPQGLEALLRAPSAPAPGARDPPPRSPAAPPPRLPISTARPELTEFRSGRHLLPRLLLARDPRQPLNRAGPPRLSGLPGAPPRPRPPGAAAPSPPPGGVHGRPRGRPSACGAQTPGRGWRRAGRRGVGGEAGPLAPGSAALPLRGRPGRVRLRGSRAR